MMTREETVVADVVAIVEPTRPKAKNLRDAINKASDIDDLDEAVLLVQDALGVETGDWATMVFCDLSPDDWKRLDADHRSVRLIQYARSEMTGLMSYNAFAPIEAEAA